MREFEPPIDVVIFSEDENREPRLYHAIIPAYVRWDILRCPPGLRITIPTSIKELPDNQQVPILNIVENLTPFHWNQYRNMN